MGNNHANPSEKQSSSFFKSKSKKSHDKSLTNPTNTNKNAADYDLNLPSNGNKNDNKHSSNNNVAAGGGEVNSSIKKSSKRMSGRFSLPLLPSASTATNNASAKQSQSFITGTADATAHTGSDEKKERKEGSYRMFTKNLFRNSTAHNSKVEPEELIGIPG